MARLESQAVAGYFPTPEHLIPLIARELHPSDAQWSRPRFVDPCAGEGEAIFKLRELFAGNPDVYVCELERDRHEILKGRAGHKQALRGDAFRVDFKTFAGLLYLNPPYDHDRKHGRLEERFLQRFTRVLVDAGILVYVVPLSTLSASAETLATHYDDLRVLRFPPEDYAAFKQVVLFARKCERRFTPSATILNQIASYVDDVESIPVLGVGDAEPIGVPNGEYAASPWEIRRVDIEQIASEARVWQMTGKTGRLEPVPNVLPDLPVSELLYRKFPVATPPRPAHIAAGIASGLFNGRRVSSTASALPDLLVKGVYEREYVDVEHKENKEGDTVAVVQVQQPKLVVVVLDLATGLFHDLRPGGETGSTKIDAMTLEDVLKHYGPDLLRVMREQCPALYEPERDAASLELAPVSRRLFNAQADAARAILALLGGNAATPRQRRRKGAVLLGEIGSGKTTVVSSVLATISRRPLVLCPPHLLQSWTDEVAAVLPGAEVRIIGSVDEVDTLAADDSDHIIVSVVSRETAKLGHGHESVGGRCAHCGSRVSRDDHGAKRARCSGKTLSMNDNLARAAHSLARQLALVVPEEERVEAILCTRHMQRCLKRLAKRENKPEWAGLDDAWARDVLSYAIDKLAENSESAVLPKLIGSLLLELADSEIYASTIDRLLKQGGWKVEEVARDVVLLWGDDASEDYIEKLYKPGSWQSAAYRKQRWAAAENIAEGIETKLGILKRVGDVVMLDKRPPGSTASAIQMLARLTTVGAFGVSEECGEPLYQATASPRRFPLARYIAKRHRKTFDLLVIDESHEYNSADSAQAHAALRLIGMGLPVIEMTGSVMNGYAESLFTQWHALSPAFRGEFEREDRQRFIDRYGFRKRVVTEKDRESGEVVAFGSHSDRVIRSERNVGTAPGILPLFLFRHLLTIAVTLHKADLAQDLPQCHHFAHHIEPDAEQLAGYKHLVEKLITQIRKDQFVEGKAGKLFGQLAEIPSYVDRCTTDVGNQEGGGEYVITYPDGEEVARGEAFPASYRLPKERAMLDMLRSELAEGRNVMVFSWHVELLPRLARIIEQDLGIAVAVLNSNKVGTAKRQEWITKNVVNKGRRVMLANPVTIQTGLNNLVWFASEWWHENPAVNPIIYRQGNGRIDRIGATKETRVHFPVYAQTLQVQLHELLMRKVAISTATDGLDPESVLIAAGGSDDASLVGLSVGRQLWQILNRAAAAE